MQTINYFVPVGQTVDKVHGPAVFSYCSCLPGLRFQELLAKLLRLGVLVLQIQRIHFGKDIGQLQISSGLL